MKTHSSRRESFLLKYPVAFPTAHTQRSVIAMMSMDYWRMQQVTCMSDSVIHYIIYRLTGFPHSKGHSLLIKRAQCRV